MIRSSSSKRHRRLPVLITVALTLVTLAPAASHAGPIGFSLSGGRYDNLAGTDQPYFAGVGARIGFASFAFAPNAEWLFVDGAQAYTLNLDATMVVLPAGAASVWVGGGVCYRTVDPDEGDAVTDQAVNVLAGAGLNLIPMKPFGQVKWVIEDGETPIAISVGVRF